MQAKRTLAHNESLSQFVWTLLILGFFGVQAVVWLFAITLTANSSSQAIVAGYDEQALKWDEQRAQQIASEALGWSASFAIDDQDNFGNLRQVAVRLSDRQHQAVAGAQVELKVFHCGHAAMVEVHPLVESDPGIYSATFKMEFAGKWDFSLVAVRGNQRFLANERVAVEPWGGTP